MRFSRIAVARAAVAATRRFEYVTTKISAGSEVKGVYCSGDALPLGPFGAEDKATLLLVDPAFLSGGELDAIRIELSDFDSLWAQHYSSYNKRKSWEAFALRGFSDEPGFIIKPAEMSKKWKEENAALMSERPRMTKAAEHFPATLAACAQLAGPEQCDRIRFMRLRAKGGELARHADITDREAGTADGMISRFHIPIVTSPAVRFSGWTERGERLDTQWPEGALCYLDQRKPHTVTNSDPELARVHLVIDAVSNGNIRELLGAAQQQLAA